MTGRQKAGTMGRAAWIAAAAAVLCLPLAWAAGQHNSAPPSRPAPEPHYSAPRYQPSRPQASGPRSAPQYQSRPSPQYQGRPAPQYQTRPTPQYQSRPSPQFQGRPMGNTAQRPGYGYPGSNVRPAYPGSPYQGPGPPRTAYPGYPNPANPGFARPANPGSARPIYSPPGHLGDWLNQHRTVPVQEQERMLRSDPSFRGLPASEQQRVVQQLRQVDQMPDQQRQRRLARAEALEHMSPQDRMRVSSSAQRWASQPQERQSMMKNAFRDLRGVPPDQRLTVLNSDRYKDVFSAEERGILADVLRAEPYQPAR